MEIHPRNVFEFIEYNNEFMESEEIKKLHSSEKGYLLENLIITKSKIAGINSFKALCLIEGVIEKRKNEVLKNLRNQGESF